MSAISLLSEIIAQGGKATSDFYGDEEAFFDLIRHGYLRETGVAASVVCDDCDAPHSALVVYENDGYGYLCPDLGFVPLAPSRLTAYMPDLSLLVSRLADFFGCRQRKSSSLHGQTWRIGAIVTPSETVMLYFHPTLQTEDDVRDLQRALGQEVRSAWRLAVTSRGVIPVVGLATARLDDLVEIDRKTGDLQRLADPGILAGVPRKNPGGRPGEHRDLLKSLIEDRICSGKADGGVNAEARKLRAAFQSVYPDKPIPSESTIKRHIRAARGSS